MASRPRGYTTLPPCILTASSPPPAVPSKALTVPPAARGCSPTAVPTPSRGGLPSFLRWYAPAPLLSPAPRVLDEAPWRRARGGGLWVMARYRRHNHHGPSGLQRPLRPDRHHHDRAVLQVAQLNRRGGLGVILRPLLPFRNRSLLLLLARNLPATWLVRQVFQTISGISAVPFHWRAHHEGLVTARARTPRRRDDVCGLPRVRPTAAPGSLAWPPRRRRCLFICLPNLVLWLASRKQEGRPRRLPFPARRFAAAQTLVGALAVASACP